MRERKGSKGSGSARDRRAGSKRFRLRGRELAKENLRLRQRLREQTGLADFFCRVDLGDLERLPHEIARAMRELLKLDGVRVFLLRPDRVLELAGEAGSGRAEAVETGAAEWQTGTLEAAGGDEFPETGPADPIAASAGVRGYLSLPLVAPGKKTVGLLVGHTFMPRTFSEEELSLGRQFAAGAAMAIENARLLAQARARMAELENAYHAKSEFLNTMAHELRTPMNVIIGNTELLEAGYYGELSELARKALQVTQKNAQNLLSVVSEVLELARLEVGQLPLQPESFSVAELIEELRSSFAPLAQKKGIALECTAAAELRMKQDRKKLKRVLENLLANAVKYTDHGGVSVRAFEPAPARVAFEVRDSGIGIRPDDLERIFEPFQVAESVDRVKYPGTGLGLSLVKRLVQMLQGEIGVNSELGKGATFTVTLPAVLAGTD